MKVPLQHRRKTKARPTTEPMTAIIVRIVVRFTIFLLFDITEANGPSPDLYATARVSLCFEPSSEDIL